MKDQAATAEPNDAAFIYIRRHGPSAQRYHGNYPKSGIRADARVISAWLGQGKSVYCYYNNDVGGYAVQNAASLKALLEQESARG
jgi:uncharacterized protein YecE (DUF72 family)